MIGRVRPRFGPAAPQPLDPACPSAPVWCGVGSAKLGIGSVGEGGSVRPRETPSRSSASWRPRGLSVVLKIRVSMVRLTRIGLSRFSPFGQTHFARLS